jgi:microcystin-dependent protein
MKMLKLIATSGIAMASALTLSTPAQAQSEPLLGQLALVGYNFCPRGWADASGQILSIAQNTALFSLYGTQYGGDGQTTFALPDLRGRSPIHIGQGPGLPNYTQGQQGGATSFTMTVTQMPAHTHAAGVQTASGTANTVDPRLAAFSRKAQATDGYLANGTPSGRFMAENTVILGATGGSQPVNKVSPFLALRWCVALQGIFPSRN